MNYPATRKLTIALLLLVISAAFALITLMMFPKKPTYVFPKSTGVNYFDISQTRWKPHTSTRNKEQSTFNYPSDWVLTEKNPYPSGEFYNLTLTKGAYSIKIQASETPSTLCIFKDIDTKALRITLEKDMPGYYDQAAVLFDNYTQLSDLRMRRALLRDTGDIKTGESTYIICEELVRNSGAFFNLGKFYLTPDKPLETQLIIMDQFMTNYVPANRMISAPFPIPDSNNWTDLWNNWVLFTEGSSTVKAYNSATGDIKTLLGPERALSRCSDACGYSEGFYFNNDRSYLVYVWTSGEEVTKISIVNTKTQITNTLLTIKYMFDFDSMLFSTDGEILKFVGLKSQEPTSATFKKSNFSLNLTTAELTNYSDPIETTDTSTTDQVYTNNYGRYSFSTGNVVKDIKQLICPNEEHNIYLVQQEGESDNIRALTCARDSSYPLEVRTYDKETGAVYEMYDVTVTDTFVGGVKAKRTTYTAKSNFEGFGEPWFVLVTFSKDGKFYEIYLKQKQLLPAFENILMTFKFYDDNGL